MGKKKPQVKPPAMTTTKAKAQSKRVEEAPAQPQVSGQRRQTRSQVPPRTGNVVLDDDGNGEHGATSSDHDNPAIPIPVPVLATPGRNRLETRASNTNQHPGELHNTYTVKKRTKQEMLEVRRIASMEQEKKAEEASRQATKLDGSMKLIAEYEENLRGANIDITPVARARQGPPHHHAEATPIPQTRALRRTYASLDVMAAADVTPNGSEDEEPAVIESELTNQNDDDYVDDDEGEEEGTLTDDYTDTNGGKVAAKAGEKRKQEQRRTIKEIDREVPDSESDDDARPKKRTKDSAAAKGSAAVKGSTAAQRLIPRDEVVEMNLDDGKKKAKEKKGVVLRGAVNAHRSERNPSERDQGPVKDSVTRADLDKPERNNATQKPNRGVVKDWAATVSKLSSSSKPSNTTRSSHIFTLTERSTSSKTSHDQRSTTSKLRAKKAADLPNDTDGGSDGAFSDNDETVGNERDAAVNSPPKNGVRATSSGIVKVKDLKTTVTLRDQPRGKKGRKLALSNKDLPDGVHKKDRWHQTFIPTFLLWVGQQADPWNIPDDEVVDVLQKIWDVVYKNIPYIVEQKDAVCAVALQRASDSWRATIGSTAITVAISVFENSDDDFSDEDRQAFAQEQLDTLAFLYGDIESEPYRFLLRGPMVLHTFAAHYCAIQGAIKVPSLGDVNLLDNQAYGALAMSAAAAERALTLIARGNITIEAIRQSKTAHKKLVLEQGPSDVKGETNFSEKYWGQVTRDYGYSASKLRDVSKEYIFVEARRLSKHMTSHHDRDESSHTQVAEPPSGHRAWLADVI